MRPDFAAVTFDCWSTLIFESDPGEAFARRVVALRNCAQSSGRRVVDSEGRSALEFAWQRHVELWNQGIASGAHDIACWALGRLGVHQAGTVEALGARFAHAALESEILPLDGARRTLERLAEAGVRRALVCDTGFSPGRVVRLLLERAGLLDLLEVQIFSDEHGVPKPHPRIFQAALGPLGVAPDHALHVGDLRRTDVAGARGAGMRTVRLRDHHDDRSDLPEADVVADSHAHLVEVLGLS